MNVIKEYDSRLRITFRLLYIFVVLTLTTFTVGLNASIIVFANQTGEGSSQSEEESSHKTDKGELTKPIDNIIQDDGKYDPFDTNKDGDLSPSEKAGKETVEKNEKLNSGEVVENATTSLLARVVSGAFQVTGIILILGTIILMCIYLIDLNTHGKHSLLHLITFKKLNFYTTDVKRIMLCLTIIMGLGCCFLTGAAMDVLDLWLSTIANLF